MCLLLETIKVKNRRFVRLEYHQARVERSLAELGVPRPFIDLRKELSIPGYLDDGIYKCRVVYGSNIQQVEFLPYVPRQIKLLKVVRDDQTDYHLKYASREPLSRLLSNREDCDDILIVKNSLVTDTSYSNILLFDGKQWVTPDMPLLGGTQRQYLLDTGMVKSQRVKIDDLPEFQKFMLINAMLDFDETRALPVSHIIY